ncbi:MAG: DUF4349 domain-containing protein, partial [Jiangellaceae bacterium]
MTALSAVGTIQSADRQSEDVATQVKDVDARVRAQERSLARLETLMGEAARLGDAIRLESEITRRQADLDSLKAQQALPRGPDVAGDDHALPVHTRGVRRAVTSRRGRLPGRPQGRLAGAETVARGDRRGGRRRDPVRDRSRGRRAPVVAPRALDAPRAEGRRGDRSGPPPSAPAAGGA